MGKTLISLGLGILNGLVYGFLARLAEPPTTKQQQRCNHNNGDNRDNHIGIHNPSLKTATDTSPHPHLSDSGESDTQRHMQASYMSDSPESDKQVRSASPQLSDSPESDMQGHVRVPYVSDSGESDTRRSSSTGREKLDSMASTSRMTSFQRREQLIEIGRSLFASKGFEAVSVEEIAATAKVSKPIVYEHFGGKEGLYAVVVDREMRALTDTLVNALSDQQAHPRQIVERAALALLTYVEENAKGFRVLTRDSPKTDPAGSFSSLLGDISIRVEDLLTESFKRQHLPAKGVPYYAQMLIGMTVYTCQYWADQRKLSKEQLAAHIVNLAWYGLSRMEAKPELRFEGDKAQREAEKRMEREERKAVKGPKSGDPLPQPSPVTTSSPEETEAD